MLENTTVHSKISMCASSRQSSADPGMSKSKMVLTLVELLVGAQAIKQLAAYCNKVLLKKRMRDERRYN